MRNLLDLFKIYNNETTEEGLVVVIEGKMTRTQAAARYKIPVVPIGNFKECENRIGYFFKTLY